MPFARRLFPFRFSALVVESFAPRLLCLAAVLFLLGPLSVARAGPAAGAAGRKAPLASRAARLSLFRPTARAAQ